MKEAWCLATTLRGDTHRVVELYGRRFTCEALKAAFMALLKAHALETATYALI